MTWQEQGHPLIIQAKRTRIRIGHPREVADRVDRKLLERLAIALPNAGDV